MKKVLSCLLFLSLAMSISSCGMVKGKGEAEDVAKSFFNSRIQKGWEETDPYYSKLFWKNTTTQDWENIKNLVSKAMGNMKTFSLQSWNIQSKVNTNELSGTLVRLIYDVEYEKGSGVETLVLHKPLLGKKFTILGHNINSAQIQNLINKGIQAAAAQETDL